MASATKDRILTATADLFRRHGYTGTGLKQIVADAQAPFGSVYHFFPGGKQELGEAVVRMSGQMYLELFETIVAAAPSALAGVRDFFAGAALVLRETDYEDACPIATVALEVASTNETLRIATADVFESWVDAASRHLRTAGIARKRARDLAIVLVELLEGAFLLCRAAKDTEAMDVAGRTAVALVRTAIPDTRRR